MIFQKPNHYNFDILRSTDFFSIPLLNLRFILTAPTCTCITLSLLMIKFSKIKINTHFGYAPNPFPTLVMHKVDISLVEKLNCYNLCTWLDQFSSPSINFKRHTHCSFFGWNVTDYIAIIINVSKIDFNTQFIKHDPLPPRIHTDHQ